VRIRYCEGWRSDVLLKRQMEFGTLIWEGLHENGGTGVLRITKAA